MADGVSFKMVTEPFTKWSNQRQVEMRRAQMWTVREGGRVVRREARAKAPVLKDRGAVRYRAWRKAGGRQQGPVSGLLRNSISAGRLSRGGAAWTLKVGPRGQRVHLYSKKEEDRAHYMEAGYHAAEGMMAAVAEGAYGRVWKGI